jgi:hypothetical protein
LRMCRKYLAAVISAFNHCLRKSLKIYRIWGREESKRKTGCGSPIPLPRNYIRVLSPRAYLALATPLQSKNCPLVSEICFSEGVV